jgi:uncharacterized protein (DUF1697 family)
MTGRHVALIRGINVGHAKRVAMADLRKLFEDLGYQDVRTLGNSGNVVFTSNRSIPSAAGARLEKRLASAVGVSARITLLTAAELAVAVAENPLLKVAGDPSRLLVAFLNDPAHRAKLEPLAARDWANEALAVGKRVAYLWCPEGILASPLGKAVGRALGEAVTARNWATTLKLNAIAQNR